MTTYISLLRGINVSGRNLIKMVDLRKMYEDLGFGNVTTYVQSGNVVFTSKTANTNSLEEKISAQIKTEFGFDVPVFVLTVNKLKEVIEENPFLQEPNKEQSFFHVTFLHSLPGDVDLPTIENKKLEGEDIVLSNDTVYLYCPKGYGKTKLNNNFLESKLKVGATTRNWKTTLTLNKIAEDMKS